MDKIQTLITEKSEQMAKAIKNGASVEIHASKDGIKVYEIRKKVIRENEK
nr:MAG TPA: hypothetical protein [Caudoviricetes sp.]